MTNFWYDLSDLQYGTPLRTSAQILTYIGVFEQLVFVWLGFFPSCFYLAAASKVGADTLLQKPEYLN